MALRTLKNQLWPVLAVAVCLVAFLAPVYVIVFVLPPPEAVIAPNTPAEVTEIELPMTGTIAAAPPAAERPSFAVPPQAPLLPRPVALQPVNPAAVMPFPPIVAATPKTTASIPSIPPATPLPTIHVEPSAPVGSQPHSKLPASQLMAQKGLEKKAPILMRIFKQEAELEVWKRDKSGTYVHLKSYPICRWSGLLGPKVRTGDLQSPEGFYAVTPAAMNPNSSYHLSFNIGFPNAFDRAHGRSGSFLMVHGDCKSVGCYAMTNAQITEIYQLATDAFDGGQAAFQVQAYPFRMTPQNFARHRNSPHVTFWQNLKEGHDLFEVTRQPPQVQVCERRYGFGSSCGPDRVAQNVMAKVTARRKADETALAALIKRGTAVAPLSPAVATRLDGGTHPSFAGLLAQR